jgi:hypothetical protein
MINLDLGGNGDINSATDDVVNEAINTLDNPLQKVKQKFILLIKNNVFRKNLGSCFKMSRT